MIQVQVWNWNNSWHTYIHACCLCIYNYTYVCTHHNIIHTSPSTHPSNIFFSIQCSSLLFLPTYLLPYQTLFSSNQPPMNCKASVGFGSQGYSDSKSIDASPQLLHTIGKNLCHHPPLNCSFLGFALTGPKRVDATYQPNASSLSFARHHMCSICTLPPLLQCINDVPGICKKGMKKWSCH